VTHSLGQKSQKRIKQSQAKRSSSLAEEEDNDNGLLLLFFVALGAVVVFSMFHNEHCIACRKPQQIA
jgi:hypothetical protein